MVGFLTFFAVAISGFLLYRMASEVFCCLDLVEKIGRMGGRREVKGITKAGFSACKSTLPSVLRRHSLQKWLSKNNVRWRSLEEVRESEVASNVVERFVRMGLVSPPKGGLKKVVSSLLLLDGGMSRSVDPQIFERRMGKRSVDEDSILRAEEETREEVGRREAMRGARVETEEVKRAVKEYVESGEGWGYSPSGHRFCVRARWEAEREDEEIRVFLERKEARKRLLGEELRKLGVERRGDSSLCRLYEQGRAGMEAEEVAKKMAHVKWLHEWVWEKYSSAVEREVSETAEEEGFFSGIYSSATRTVQQREEFRPPEKWPWL